MNLHIVLSGLRSDSHTWNLVFLQLLLEDLGHWVKNLGSCTPPELISEACWRLRPDLLVISSVNGHGILDGKELMFHLKKFPAAQRIPTVIGGKLTTNSDADHERAAELLHVGFDAVFLGAEAIARFRSYLAQCSASHAVVARGA